MRFLSSHFGEQPRPISTSLAVALAGSLITQSVLAGPAVGSVVGTPSATSTTIHARVVSSTPVVAQVTTPREVCYDELQAQEAQPSGAGALIGAVAGAAVGNAMGKGSGRAVATGVGLIGGAILGNHIENRGRPTETRTVRRCEQQSSYENQVVAYSVVYEINGQRYTTQLPHEPGATIPVQMTVSPVTSVSSYRMNQEPAVFVAPVVRQVRYVSPQTVRYVSPVVVINNKDRHHHRPYARERVVYPVVYTPPRHHDHQDRRGHRWN